MDIAEKVKQEAIMGRKILDNFLKKYPEIEREFKASFHLRPTSSGNTTIVSTLPLAPMRGKTGVKTNKLEDILVEIYKILCEPDYKKKDKMMLKIGFGKRKTEAQREENVQAALIRDIVLRPMEYNQLKFVASEFELFEYRKIANKELKPDVFAFNDGILYDIEFKNKRLTETIEQAYNYVNHIKENLQIYNDCLNEFPNCRIGKILDVKGIAIVPFSKKSISRLEQSSKKHDIELWYFDEYTSYNFIR